MTVAAANRFDVVFSALSDPTRRSIVRPCSSESAPPAPLAGLALALALGAFAVAFVEAV